MKNLTVNLLVGLAIIITACSCGRKREEHTVKILFEAADAWLATNSINGKATCYVMFINGDPQMDVVGLASTNQQASFVAMMRSNSIHPSHIRFWREKPTLSFGELLVPEVSSASTVEREAELKDKLLKTVTLND